METISNKIKDPALLTDDQLITEIKNNNTEFFAVIVRRYNQRLYRTAVSFGVYDDDCEEVLQLTYISAFTHLDQFRGEAKFSTWLTRILINECYMLKRKNQRKVKMNEVDLVTIPAGDHLNPERAYMDKERKEIIENAVKQLPDKYKTVFMLKEVEGLSIEETSESLEISKSNVKVRLHRAKLMLIDIIKEAADFSGLFVFGNERCNRVSDSVMNYITSLKKSR